MSHTETLHTPSRGMSRFRVVVTSSSNPLRPYGWDIMDEGCNRCAMRSPERYRTSKDAWEAGTKELRESSKPELSVDHAKP